jgi:hypothetical protein
MYIKINFDPQQKDVPIPGFTPTVKNRSPRKNFRISKKSPDALTNDPFGIEALSVLVS